MKRYHRRHYFGGAAVILLILQVLTGTFLTMFYEPDLTHAYASVRYLYNELFTGGWIRDIHRWLALFIILAILVHFVRSVLRKDFLRPRKRISWLTGMLMIVPIFSILVTGFTLPWEWKAYWFMEMVPNLVGELPIVGGYLKDGLTSLFTLNRAFVVHIFILPIAVLILIDIHVLSTLRKRRGGIPGYILRHGFITIPIALAVVFLALNYQMPTQDPDIMPLPLEGRFVPMPEWYALALYVPFRYFDGPIAVALGLYLPLGLFIVVTIAPFFLKRKPLSERKPARFRLPPAARPFAAFAAVVGVLGVLLVPLYAVSYTSPTLGCNSCHNINMGLRMGIPPAEFRDRAKLPLLDDNQWMVDHWFEPQRTW